MILVLIMDREHPAKWTAISSGWRSGIELTPTLEIAYPYTFERDDGVTPIIFVGLSLFPPKGEPDR